MAAVSTGRSALVAGPRGGGARTCSRSRHVRRARGRRMGAIDVLSSNVAVRKVQPVRRPSHESVDGKRVSLSRTLADFVERTQWNDVPVAVRHEALRALVNYFAAALAGSADPAIERATAVFARLRAGEDAGADRPSRALR